MNNVFKVTIIGVIALSTVIASAGVYQYLVQTQTDINVLTGITFDGQTAEQIDISDSISLYPGESNYTVHSISTSNVLPDPVNLLIEYDNVTGIDFNIIGTGVMKYGDNAYNVTLQPGVTIDITYNYTADVMLSAGTYQFNTTISRI